MPEVTVELSPSGEPKATTWSPTRSTCGRAEARRRQLRAALHVEHGEVVRRAAADDRRRRSWSPFWSTISIGPSLLDGVGDDVVVGDVVARPVEHEAGAGRAVLLALVLRQHLDRARQQPLRDRGDRVVAGRQRRLRDGAGLVEAAARPDPRCELGVPVLVRRSADHAADHADDQGQHRDHRPHPARAPGRAGGSAGCGAGPGTTGCPGDVRRTSRLGCAGVGRRRRSAGGGPGGAHWCGGVLLARRAARSRRRSALSGAVSSLLARVLVAHAVLTLHGDAGRTRTACRSPSRPYGASVRRSAARRRRRRARGRDRAPVDRRSRSTTW